MCLELYKVVQAKPVEAYRNTFANLALPLFAMAEPIPPKVRNVFKTKGCFLSAHIVQTIWPTWCCRCMPWAISLGPHFITAACF